MSGLDLPVLKANSNWVAIDVISARKAFEDASAGAVKLISYHDGYPSPVTLEKWMQLDPRDHDSYVTTSQMHGLKKITIPRVVICVNYSEYRSREQPCTPENLLKRYGHKDAVTGKKLKRENFSREHVKPRSKGGTDGWDNIVPMDKKLNSRRGNKSYSEVGLNKPKVLRAPAPLLPINSIVNKMGYKEWDDFGVPRPEKS